MLAVPAHASAVTVVSLTFDDGRASQDGCRLGAERPRLRRHLLHQQRRDRRWRLAEPRAAAHDRERRPRDRLARRLPHRPARERCRRAAPAALRRPQLAARAGLRGHELRLPVLELRRNGAAVGRRLRLHERARGLGAEHRRQLRQTQTCAESMPPRNRWAVRTFKPVDVETSVADLQAQVLNALNHGGGWVPIMFHDICSSCGFYAMSTADLNAFLDWLATQPVEVRTVRDVMDVTDHRAGRAVARAGAARPGQPAAEPRHGDGRRRLGAAVPDPGALLAAGRRLVGRGRVGPRQQRRALRLLVDDDRPAVERPCRLPRARRLARPWRLRGPGSPAAIASASPAGTAPRARSASSSRVRPGGVELADGERSPPRCRRPRAGRSSASTCRRCRAAPPRWCRASASGTRARCSSTTSG